MADDVLTRNSADELALRVVQSSGDTGMNKDDVYTRDSQGRLSVRTVGGSGGGSGGASTAADVSFDPSGLNVITGTNVQSALAQVDSSVKGLQDSVSVLTTTAELSTVIGGTTTVALSELTAMVIDGRPSYKQAGATVYAKNGVVGIIDSVDSTNAVITTVLYRVEQQGGSSEIVWDKVQKMTVDTSSYQGWAYSSLNFGVLSDGDYSFYLATKMLTQTMTTEHGEVNTLDGKFADSVLLVEFRIRDGACVYGICKVVAPFIGFLNGSSIYGPSSYPSGRPQISKKPNGEFVFYYTSSGLCTSDVPLYLPDGEYECWKVSKLKNQDGVESDISFYNQYFEASAHPDGYDNFLHLSYQPLVMVNQTNYSTSSYFSGGFSEGANCLLVDLVNPDLDIGTDQGVGGHSYIAENVFYIADTTTQDVCVLRLSTNPNCVVCVVERADGVFKDVNWKLGFQDNRPENTIIYVGIFADGFSFSNKVVGRCLYGNNGNERLSFDVTSRSADSFNKVVSFDKYVKPDGSKSDYMIPHNSGLVEIGGIVPIADTLQPDVAFGNVPVVFPNELANANFVPTITVMTDGTFKRVMADVANPTTTGFDLCVRNVDTEAVSGIKIAWKVVGTKK